MIPIDRITVVNPRVRSKKVFKGIVENIAEIGLKRPITVTSRQGDDGPLYDLVCGQGRLEAFRQLGQSEVPALIVTADQEDCFVASLVENCARRQPSQGTTVSSQPKPSWVLNIRASSPAVIPWRLHKA